MERSPAPLRRGLPLLTQQFTALFKKNLLLAWRSKRASFLQLFSSLFFIFLIFCIEKAIDSRFASSTAAKNVFDPEPLVLPPIPPCEDKYYVKKPCYDFVWSGSGSARVSRIVDSIMKNNPGRPIPSSKVMLTFCSLIFLDGVFSFHELGICVLWRGWIVICAIALFFVSRKLIDRSN